MRQGLCNACTIVPDFEMYDVSDFMAMTCGFVKREEARTDNDTNGIANDTFASSVRLADQAGESPGISHGGRRRRYRASGRRRQDRVYGWPLNTLIRLRAFTEPTPLATLVKTGLRCR